jgi:hypothetical protein
VRFDGGEAGQREEAGRRERLIRRWLDEELVAAHILHLLGPHARVVLVDAALGLVDEQSLEEALRHWRLNVEEGPQPRVALQLRRRRLRLLAQALHFALLLVQLCTQRSNGRLIVEMPYSRSTDLLLLRLQPASRSVCLALGCRSVTSSMLFKFECPMDCIIHALPLRGEELTLSSNSHKARGGAVVDNVHAAVGIQPESKPYQRRGAHVPDREIVVEAGPE